MAKGGFTHNVSFTIGSAEYGFQLADDGKGKKAYNRANLNLLPDATPTEGARNTDINPEKKLVSEQVSFKGGITQTWFTDADKYYYADGVDACVDGAVGLAPARTDEYRPTWAALNTWAITGTTPVFTGATLATYTAQAGTLTVYDTTIVAALQNRPTNFMMDVANNGGTVILTLNAGTVTQSQTITASTVTMATPMMIPGSIFDLGGTITASAYVNAAAGTVVVSNIRQGSPRAFCQFGGSIYCGVDNVLMGMGATDSWFKYVTSAVNNITDIEAWGAYLYVASGLTPRWHTVPTSAWTTWTASTVVPASFNLARCGQLLVVSQGQQVYTAATAGTDTWVTLPTIGNSGTSITAIIGHPTNVFIATTDGVYTVNSSTLIEKYLDLSAETNANTGKGSVYWQNAIYVPSGDYGLWRVDDDGVASNIGPSMSGMSYYGTYRKQVQAMVGDQAWLSAFEEKGGVSRYLRGRETSAGFVWHDIGTGPAVADYYDADLFTWTPIVGGGTFKRLFLATSSGIIYYYHPETYDGFTLVRASWFQTPGTIYTARHDMGFRNRNKSFYSVEVTADMGSENKPNIELYYSINNAAAALAGTINSSTAQLYLPATINGKDIALQFKLNAVASGSSGYTYSPNLVSYRINGQLLEDKKFTWDMGLMLTADSLHRNSGANERINVETAVSAINTGVNSDWPVTFVDIDGSTHYVVMRLTADQILSDDANGQTKRYIGLNLQEVDWQ